MKVKMYEIKGEFDERHMTVDFAENMYNWNGPTTIHVAWEVCGYCDGSGVTTSHIECDGGGFTSSEWAEICDGDPDFAEDYFSGKYDRNCPDCNGRRVVPVPTDKNDKKLIKELQRIQYVHYQMRAEEEAERRMGA